MSRKCNQTQVKFSSKLEDTSIACLSYGRKTVKRLALLAIGLIGWLLVWALVFKMGDEVMLRRNYLNLKIMTPVERLLWDIVPFRYRGDDYWMSLQKLTTLLNCVVFVPFGVLFCYVFRRQNVIKNVAIGLGISIFIEMLQFVTMFGNPATEDLITNTFGCLVGYVLNALLFRHLSNKTKTIVLAISNVLLVVATIYSIVTLVGAYDTIYGIITRTLV